MKYTTLTQNVDVNKITKYDCKYCISDRGKYECLKLKGDTNFTSFETNTIVKKCHHNLNTSVVQFHCGKNATMICSIER